MPSTKSDTARTLKDIVTDKAKEMVSDRYGKAMEAAEQGIGKAVRAIYVALPDGKAEHLGSCVLVEVREHRLLVTAAHVVDEIKNGALYIPAAGSTKKLQGSGAITTPPGGLRRMDRFDFAVLKITPELAEQLAETRYIQESEFMTPTPALGRAYMALGYPNVRNKNLDHAKRTIKQTKLSVGSTVIEDATLARKLRVSGDDHYFIKYDKRTRDPVTRAITQAIEPTGMSGGGLFDLGFFNLASMSKPPQPAGLAGILIEYHPDKNRRMVAVKIEAMIETINNLISAP
jgi:hypothetical protein